MQLGDLVRVVKSLPASSRHKDRQWRLALVVGDGYAANETKVQMISDGTVLWFLTKELEAVK